MHVIGRGEERCFRLPEVAAYRASELMGHIVAFWCDVEAGATR